MQEQILDTPENVKMLNERLGITSKENLFNSSGIRSINEMLENSKRDFELLCQNISSKKEEVEAAEKHAMATFDNIKELSESGETDMKQLETATHAISDFNNTIESMVTLIHKGNDIIDRLYDAIIRTDILDPDLINATASVIHSIRESNDNLISFNMQKMNLEHQFRLAIETEKQKQKHRLELEFFKFKLRQQEIEHKAQIKREEEANKNADNVVDITDGTNGNKSWSQSDVAEMLRNM